MNSLKIPLAFLLCLGCALATQYTPIANTTPGIFYGNPEGKIHIEMIYDPMCTLMWYPLGYDTRDFDVQVTRRLEKELDSSIGNQIYWQMVGQAKPWHITAFKILQGVRFVQDQKGAEAAVACFRFFLDNIATWDNTRIQTETITSYMDKLADQFQQLTGIPAAQIRP